jgi:NADP-dependent 3-hydroxy acid dehydrogenase YdfG
LRRGDLEVDGVEDVERIFVSAAIAFRNVDILVNNAGVYKFGAIDRRPQTAQGSSRFASGRPDHRR